MNIYEDEEEAADKSVLAFLKRNKQLVWMAVAFVVAYTVMGGISRQMDDAGARQSTKAAAKHQKANPWSVEK